MSTKKFNWKGFLWVDSAEILWVSVQADISIKKGSDYSICQGGGNQGFLLKWEIPINKYVMAEEF